MTVTFPVSIGEEDEKKSAKNANTVSNNRQSADTLIAELTKPKQRERFNPFAPFALLRHPFIFIPSIPAGIFFGAMFAIEAILPQAFTDTYGLNWWQTGLCYLGAGVGNVSGAFIGARLSDSLLLHSRRLRGGKAVTEDHLTAKTRFIFNPLGLLLFGWVVEYKLSIWGAIIGFGIQCFANVQVMTTVTAYLVDSVPGRGASATAAAANCVRLGFGCILSVVGNPMLAKLRAGWTSSLLACLSWFAMVLAIILKIRASLLNAGADIRIYNLLISLYI